MAASRNATDGELREFFRRAAAHPDRKGQLRRDAFMRLLSLGENPTDAQKMLIMEYVREYFVDFPDLHDQAINIVYDMCEDQNQEIRIAGYSAITSVSKVDRAWLTRNADVLVQLLQIDDANEVAFVKRELQEHIDINPHQTIRVLVDQCVFDPAELAEKSSEERELRERLRNLVLRFLAQKYKVCIARAVRSPEVEFIVLKGLTEAIPRLTPDEAHSVVTNVLVHLPALSHGPPSTGTRILDAVLAGARNALTSELSLSSSARSDLKDTIAFLSLALFLASPPSTLSDTKTSRTPPSSPVAPRVVLNGYGALLSMRSLGSPLTSDTTLATGASSAAISQLSAQLCAMLDLVDRDSSAPNGFAAKARFFSDAMPVLLPAFRTYIVNDRTLQESCHRIVRHILDHIIKLEPGERTRSFSHLLPGFQALSAELSKRENGNDAGAAAEGVIKKIISSVQQAEKPVGGPSTPAASTSSNSRQQRHTPRSSASTPLRRSPPTGPRSSVSRRRSPPLPATVTVPAMVSRAREDAKRDDAMDVDDDKKDKNPGRSSLSTLQSRLEVRAGPPPPQQPARKRVKSDDSISASGSKPSLLERLSLSDVANTNGNESGSLPRRTQSSGSAPEIGGYAGTGMLKSATNDMDLKTRLGLSPSNILTSRLKLNRDRLRTSSRGTNRRNPSDKVGVEPMHLDYSLDSATGEQEELSIRGAAKREASLTVSDAGGGEKATSLLARLQMQDSLGGGQGGRKRKLGMYSIG